MDSDLKSGLFPLHNAAHLGNCEDLQNLIDKGLDVNAFNHARETPVFVAVACGQCEALKLLLNSDADPNRRADEYCTPALLKAIKSSASHHKCVEILLENKADPNIKDSMGWTALHEACAQKLPVLVELLIHSNTSLDSQTDRGETPLSLACCGEGSDCVQLLLKSGADPEIANEDGVSPLHLACQKGYDTCVEQVLNHGVDVDRCDKSGLSPLGAACQDNHYKCAKLLVEKNAVIMPNSDDPDMKQSPLHLAARCQGGTCLSLLLDVEDVDVNHFFRGVTPLFEAAQAGNINGCKLLLSKGAFPNVRSSSLLTPLMIAADEDHIDIVKKLVSAGANVNYTTVTSPLIVAARSESFRSFKFFLDCNADVNFMGEDGQTALFECVKWLRRDLPMTRDETFVYLSMNRLPSYVSCHNLLQRGAEVSKLFEVDRTLVDLPSILLDPVIIHLLLEFDGNRKEIREICETKSDEELWKPLIELLTTPRKLEHLCRLAVRGTLGFKRLKFIDELPLPGSLKRYLKHDTPMEFPIYTDR